MSGVKSILQKLRQRDSLGNPSPQFSGEEARALADAVEALVYIGHFAHDAGYMQTARTLHYDMAGKANEALTGLLQSRKPPRSPDATAALHE